ncbi:MAG: heavy metal translocating P-type ATPase [Azospirillaceae bacterium]
MPDSHSLDIAPDGLRAPDALGPEAPPPGAGACCPTAGAALAWATPTADDDAAAPADGETGSPLDVAAYVRGSADGGHALDLMVEGVHCGACIAKVEGALRRFPEVRQSRLNLTTRRLALTWDGAAERAADFVAAIDAREYRAVPYDPGRLAAGDRDEDKALLRALAVAGFAAANVMLLSVSVWAGHAQGMDAATRDLLHWFSALVALPAIAYAGRPFFASALSALKRGRTNMDVPISLGVVLAAGMSLAETVTSGPHAYFDSAVTLLFFLLVGRYLDRRARGRARSAAERLLLLGAGAVTVLDADGRRRAVPAEQVSPGATVLVAAGERIGIDGWVLDGASDMDAGLITGESVPVAIGPGDRVFAGAINRTAPLKLEVSAAGADTLLGEIVRLMESAEQRKARFVGIADRVARGYAPAVHGLALAAFLGWTLIGGLAWQPALMIAVAVLIITCPCALGLAVPAVQVIASGRLMRRGVLLKTGTALERLAAVDHVVFDKTGTLTLGRPDLVERPDDPAAVRLAASLAGASRHPLARALARAVPGVAVADGVREVPGSGLALDTDDGEVRLGSATFCGVVPPPGEDAAEGGPELWLARPGAAPVRFAFLDAPRADAAEVVAALTARGLPVSLFSGDRAGPVEAVAGRLGIADRRARMTPADKAEALADLGRQGRTVLMVGDGLNDAPALAAAAVSLSPSSAADISQTAADAVFQGDALAPVIEALDVARRADRLVRQNFALAFVYNLVAVPVALAGLVTPLIAAVCMSGSSVLVVANALRLGRRGRA